MIGQGNWYSSACVWRLVWLQRHDGLWDLTSDLVKVWPTFGEIAGGASRRSIRSRQLHNQV